MNKQRKFINSFLFTSGHWTLHIHLPYFSLSCSAQEILLFYSETHKIVEKEDDISGFICVFDVVLKQIDLIKLGQSNRGSRLILSREHLQYAFRAIPRNSAQFRATYFLLETLLSMAVFWCSLDYLKSYKNNVKLLIYLVSWSACLIFQFYVQISV